MKNLFFMPAGRQAWLGVANEFYKKGFEPKIWLGDPSLDEVAKKQFPDCLVLNFFEHNKAGIIRKKSSSSSLPMGVLQRKEFYVLKDKVYKMMDRQDDQRCYGRLEREAVFYLLLNYFANLIINKKIDILVASEAPHSPATMVAYGVCELLEIPRYHLMPSSLFPLMHVCKDFYGTRVQSNVLSMEGREKYFSIVRDYVKSFDSEPEEPTYMIQQKSYDQKKNKLVMLRKGARLLKNFRKSMQGEKDNNYIIHRSLFFGNNSPSAFSAMKIDKYRMKLKKSYSENVDNDFPNSAYVFFPLHYEPERTSNPDGGDFYQAYDALLALRCFVPLDVPILVKGHYSQFSLKLSGYKGCSPYFYDFVKKLGNTFLLEENVDSKKLIRNSVFTVSQTGTACLEAACFGRKSVLMGSAWFSNVPNVYMFGELENYDDLMSKPTLNKNKIIATMEEWIDQYAIVGCVNPSTEKYFRRKYPDESDQFFGEYEMACQYVGTILADFK